jgi:hypothetical protein
MTDDVRALCKERNGPGPCIKLYASDMVTVTGTYECVDWCPVLQQRIEEVTETEEVI